MRWIVGLDLRPRSEGPTRFARWLSDACRGASDRPVFVHVLEEERLRFALRLHHLDEVTAAARSAGEQLLERTGAKGELRIEQGLTADEALEDLRAAAGADGLIVGRAAGREGHHVVRLGRVARLLLRHLRSPVLVVPPDVAEGDVGDGPVVALSSLQDDALGACRLGARLASDLGRPLAVCHVARGSEPSYVAPGSWADVLERHRLEAERELERWLSSKGLRADTATALVGSTLDRALEFAEGRRAPLVVVGSRHLSTAERLVETSAGSALAATARLPVLVVPMSA